jgi:hypothetical protein
MDKKKWFLYMTDHHEGPFSTEEVLEKKASGLITQENYVWQESMDDWMLLHEVAEFRTAPPVKMEANSLLTQELHLKRNSEEEALPSQFVVVNPGLTNEIKMKPQKQKRGFPWKTLSAFTMIFGLSSTLLYSFRDSLLHHRYFILDRAPSLTQWISPLPPLQGVSLQEYESLQQASVWSPGPWDFDNLPIAIGLASPNTKPFFYITSWLVERLKLYVVGLSSTLLGESSFFWETEVDVSERLGKCQTVEHADGKPLVPGEYLVFLSPRVLSPLGDSHFTNYFKDLNEVFSEELIATEMPNLARNLKVMRTKTYFLGGMKNPDYLNQLKQYHLQLDQQFAEEIEDLTKVIHSLAKQLQVNETTFLAASKIKIQTKKLEYWNQFQSEWLFLGEQIKSILQKSRDFFHEHLFEMATVIVKNLNEIHTLQTVALHQPNPALAEQLRMFANELHSQLQQFQEQLEKTKQDNQGKTPKKRSLKQK